MPSFRVLRVAAAGAILAAAIAASCSSGPSKTLPKGPLWYPMTPGIQCVHFPGAKIITDGLEPIRIHGSKVTAVVDKVALTHLKGLRLIRAWLVPDSGTLYGVFSGYPPSAEAGIGGAEANGFEWEQREAAAGGTVRYKTWMNLLLILERVGGAARGTGSAIDVWYHVGSTHYHYRTETALVVHFNHQSC